MNIPIETFALPVNIDLGATDGPTIEQLRSMLANHLEQESKFLGVYGQAIEAHKSPLVTFILQLILTDEETHHGVLRRILSNIDSELSWTRSPEQLPTLGEVGTADAARLIKLTDEFIAEEKHGIAQSKSLMKASKGLYGDLLGLLLRTIIHDSEKHLMMLRFIRKQLKKAHAA